jgi:hypothetical protein
MQGQFFQKSQQMERQDGHAVGADYETDKSFQPATSGNVVQCPFELFAQKDECRKLGDYLHDLLQRASLSGQHPDH